MTQLSLNKLGVIDTHCNLRIWSYIFAHLGQGWPVEVIRRHTDVLMEHFGPDWLMWDSDGPVTLLKATDEQA
ncbi:MAG: hypothetical protein IT324_10800 [Anaerolineae bacterium]|nr:hypothetical protein [Anaerolineae bacterium]